MVDVDVFDDSRTIDLVDPKFKIVEIIDEKEAKCPYCGSIFKIPQRTVGMRELQLIEIEKEVAILRRTVLGSGRHYAINVRILRHRRCGNPILLMDKYTYKI